MANNAYMVSNPSAVYVGLDALDRLIGAGSGNAALVYLYFLRRGGPDSTGSVVETLKLSDAEVCSAVELLRSLGLVRRADAAGDAPRPAQAPPEPLYKDEPPEYTSEDIKNALDRGGEFPALAREAQKSLGRILSSDDLIKLFGIYDNLALPPEVILQLITYCIEELHRKNGPGRVPTMRYIEKAAYTWERAGVTSLELAEEYIRQAQTQRGAVAEMKRALQINDREPSASELKYIESWLGMGFGPEAVAMAYDRTLIKTGKLSWGYINSIINSWHTKGLHTPGEITHGDVRPDRSKRAGRWPAQQSAPTAAELADMQRLLDNMKEDQ